MKHVVLSITGASGALYGLTALDQLLRQEEVTVHLIVSRWARKVILSETSCPLEEHLRDLEGNLILCDHENMADRISSGSFQTAGMLIAPCSSGTLCSIASGLSTNLSERAAAVTLKERRPLVLMVRESPLSPIMLQQMLSLSQAGAVIMPPVPAFYTKPERIEDIVTQSVLRALSLLDIHIPEMKGWEPHA